MTTGSGKIRKRPSWRSPPVAAPRLREAAGRRPLRRHQSRDALGGAGASFRRLLEPVLVAPVRIEAIPEPITHDDDRRLPEWGFGITNVVPRATPGIDTIDPREYAEGARGLKRKIRRWRPRVVACVGVTVFRSLFASTGKVRLGLQSERLAGAEVFVLPNPSGRNAHHSIRQMRAAFSALRRHISGLRRDRRVRQPLRLSLTRTAKADYTHPTSSPEPALLNMAVSSETPHTMGNRCAYATPPVPVTAGPSNR